MSANNKPGKIPVVKNYRVVSKKLHSPVRCVHLSDLHGCIYGEHQSTLISMIQSTAPDFVVMTGDMLEIKFDRTPVGELFKALAEKYPCFAVAGNHEFQYRNYREMKDYIRSFGIHLLENCCEPLVVKEEKINLCGVDDPLNPDLDPHHFDFKHRSLPTYQINENLKYFLDKAFKYTDAQRYTILLTHRPETVTIYQKYPADLVLSGHAHGGQWRIPGILNGFFAPNQGFFPKYAGGRYDFESQVHIVSRGLAYHHGVPRIFNPVEIGVLDLLPM